MTHDTNHGAGGDRPALLVCGFGRCGSSMLMQMLNAGGYPCAGSAPDFEDPVAKNPITASVLASYRGRALKVLDPQRSEIPLDDTRIIWISRDTRQQAKSIAKFLNATTGLQMSREHVRNLRAQLDRDQAIVDRYVLRSRLTLRMFFEGVLHDPHTAARRLAWFTAWPGFDVDAAAAVVQRRHPACADGLDMEVRLMRAADAAPAAA